MPKVNMDFLENYSRIKSEKFVESLQGRYNAYLQVAKAKENKYRFVVSWFHTSCYSYNRGDKSKMQFFEEQSEAQKVYDRLLAIKQSDGTYQQGFITYLTKNF